MHAGRLIDHVGAGVTDERVVERLFSTRLLVGDLRVGHARRGAAREIVEVRHLTGGGRQERLLGAAAGHRSRAQIRDEAPGAKDGRVARLDRIHIDQTGKALGHFLRQGARNGGRRRGTGLTGREQQDRHAAAHGDFQALAGIGRELHRRHHEAVRLADEGAFTPLVFATGDHVQHFEGLLEMLGEHPARADVLGRARHRGVARIEVHLVRIRQIARNDGALEEVDVLHLVDDATDVIQILNLRLTVGAVGIDHVHGRAGGAEVHLLAPRLEIELRILRVERKVSASLGQHVFDQRTREQQSTTVTEGAARLQQDLHAGFRRIGQADLF